MENIIGMLHGAPDNMTPTTKAEAKKNNRKREPDRYQYFLVKSGINIATVDKSVELHGEDYFKKIINLCEFFAAREICFMAGQ